jgi:hypothetical protein
MNAEIKRRAEFDSSGTYRYSLWRAWETAAPTIGFVMLNPHRADDVVDDPTIRRCIGFAQSWGYGSLEVVNLFAYRTGNPLELRQVLDPIGAENDRYLISLSDRVERIMLAWGNFGSLGDRHLAVMPLLTSQTLYCLGMTKTAQPKHPLYLNRNIVPIAFQSAWQK